MVRSSRFELDQARPAAEKVADGDDKLGKACPLTAHSKNTRLPNIKGSDGDMPQHSLGFTTSHHLRNVFIMAVAAVLAFTLTLGISFARDIGGSLHAVAPLNIGGNRKAATAPDDIYKGKTLNILVLGQDTREGAGNSTIGGDPKDFVGSHQSDTAIVVQIAADRSYINMVSIPRDSVVNAPACTTSAGATIASRQQVLFNSIFATGYNIGGDIATAAGCAVKAVNTLTGLNMDQFVVADFNGLKSIIDALGGVDVCIPQYTHDDITGLDLQKGLRHLDGIQATEYARMRHGVGTDGSDIMRTTRQQYLVKTIVNETRSMNVYTDFPRLYQLTKATLSSLQMSEGLGNLQTLLGLANSLKNIDTTHIYSRTLPVEEAPWNRNHVIWSKDAGAVWQTLKEQRPLKVQTDGAQPDQGGTSHQGPGQSTPAEGSPSSDGTQLPAPDPKTGLVTTADNRLIDPVTHGVVNPEDGTIRDAVTGQYIGMADRYLFATVCAVPSKD